MNALAGCARALQYSQEAQYDEYDGNDDQSVDPITGLWDA
jgi:hypothetical protein